MPSLIKPQSVNVVTKDGELEIRLILELNLNINATGVDVSTVAREASVKPLEKPKEPENTMWAIPDFGPVERIEFGRKE